MFRAIFATILGLILSVCTSIDSFFNQQAISAKSEFQTNSKLELQLAICGSYSSPGMMFDDIRGKPFRCTILETDDYGRILFQYEAKNRITDHQESSIVICQTYDDDYVYMYEDENCIMGTYESEDVEQLKMVNDWNQPLKMEKTSRRLTKVKGNGYVDRGTEITLERAKVIKLCCSKLQIAEEQIRNMFDVDQDSLDRVLFRMTASADGIQKHYFVISDIAYHVEILPQNGTEVDFERLAAFKKECGWKYGYDQ